ncbi:MAG: hypothetical protein V2A72_04185 [Candidatus Omnitrophota bacterium]
METARDFKNSFFYLTLAVVLFCIFWVYSSTLSKNWSEDAIANVCLVENAKNALSPSLYHPHHMFYHVSGFLFSRFVQIFLPQVLTITCLQIFNSILAVFTIAVFFIGLRMLDIDRFISLCVSAGLAYTYTMWYCATSIEARMSPLAFLLLCFIFIIKIEKVKFTYILVVAMGLCHALSILLHQLSTLFAAVSIAGFFIFLKGKGRYKCLLLYIASTGFFTVTTYALIARYILGVKGIKGFLLFVTSYMHLGTWGFDFFETLNIPRAAYGFLNAQLYLPLRTLKEFLKSSFSLMGLANTIAFIAVVSMLVLPLLSFRKTTNAINKQRIIFIGWIWIIFYLVLYVTTEAPQAQYVIVNYPFMVIPSWIMIAVCADNFSSMINKRLVYLIAIMVPLYIFFWNYSFIITESTDINNNLKFKNAVFWQRNSSPKTVFLSMDWEPYIEYFAKRRVVSIAKYFPDSEEDLEEANAQLYHLLDAELENGNDIIMLDLDTAEHAQEYMSKLSKTYTFYNIKIFFSRYELQPLSTEFGLAYKIKAKS